MNYYETLFRITFSTLIFFGIMEEGEKDSLSPYLDDIVFFFTLTLATTLCGVCMFIFLN